MDLSTTRESIAFSDSTRLLKELAKPLYEAKRWMKLMGILMIVHGALTVFSGWGILVAWLPIWMGWLLWKSGKAIETAQRRGDKVALLHSMNKLKTFFTVNGIITLVGLILLTVALLVFGGTLATMFGQMQEMQQMQMMPAMPTGP